jgi:hypothetical protein
MSPCRNRAMAGGDQAETVVGYMEAVDYVGITQTVHLKANLGSIIRSCFGSNTGQARVESCANGNQWNTICPTL